MKSKNAFTLIELLVVIAIIGVLATISVIALQNVRSKARDAKRVGDVKQIRTALEMFFNDNGRYPLTSEFESGSLATGTDIYLSRIPESSTPADGDCTVTENSFSYFSDDGSDYQLFFCLGSNSGSLEPGVNIASPSSIVSWACGDDLIISSLAGHYCNSNAPYFDKCSYRTIKIGNQCWMQENLNVGSIITASSNSVDNGVLEKYCYANNSSYCLDSGSFYQWNEAMNYSTTTGARGVCPVGWHVPTHDEFTTLERAVCTSGTCNTDFPYDSTTAAWRGTDEGTKLSPGGSSGFGSIWAGYRDYDGATNYRGVYVGYWTSVGGPGWAWDRTHELGQPKSFRYAVSPNNAYCIRCIKD